MDRKRFIGAIGTLATGVILPSQQITSVDDTDLSVFKRPPYLNSGDIIGITSPAGFIKIKEIKPAVQVMESWGYKIKLGTTIGKKDRSFGGTDEERAADFQVLLDDPEVKAIMCARGGYGIVRIIDRLDWKKFKRNPKWVIGFSDATILHNHIHANCQVASLHSKMTNSFPDDWSRAEPIQVQTIRSIQDALAGKKMTYSTKPNARNKLGIGAGTLIGGNLKLIESLAGTASDINTSDKILFVEDTGEYLYSIDRMFWNLLRTGKLKGLRGLVIGAFKLKPDDKGEEFGKKLFDIVLEKVKDYNYPVCFDFPVGHQRANFAFKCGVEHQLVVTQDQVNLIEII